MLMSALEPIGRAMRRTIGHKARADKQRPQGAAVTRSEPLPLDRAKTAEDGAGVAAAPPRMRAFPQREGWGGAGSAFGSGASGREAHDGEADLAAEAVRRELARLTALLRRHFSSGADDSLLPVLADTSDPAAAASARAFLDQIRILTESLLGDADRWSSSTTAAGAFADFRRETMALLEGVEERLG